MTDVKAYIEELRKRAKWFGKMREVQVAFLMATIDDEMNKND